jgi:hypothetical protein
MSEKFHSKNIKTSGQYAQTQITNYTIIILHKNLTNVLICVNNTLFTLLHTFLHVSALKVPSLGSTDPFHEQGQQNVSVLSQDGP